jgi:hypothetical protein
MTSESEYSVMENELGRAHWTYCGAGEWHDPVTGTKYLTEDAYEVLKQRMHRASVTIDVEPVEVKPAAKLDFTTLTIRQILLYEAHASWWAGYMFGDFLQSLAGKYFAWKVNRKYARYSKSIKKARELKERGLI